MEKKKLEEHISSSVEYSSLMKMSFTDKYRTAQGSQSDTVYQHCCFARYNFTWKHLQSINRKKSKVSKNELIKDGFSLLLCNNTLYFHIVWWACKRLRWEKRPRERTGYKSSQHATAAPRGLSLTLHLILLDALWGALDDIKPWPENRAGCSHQEQQLRPIRLGRRRAAKRVFIGLNGTIILRC